MELFMSGHQPSGRGRPPTFPRHHVVEVAMEAYWREGPDGLSLNEICRRAGVSKPGFYRAFGGEDKLMDAALERYAETVLTPSFAAVDPDASLEHTLELIVTSFTDTDRVGPPGCLLARLQQTDGLGPAVAERVASLRQQSRDTYAALIESAKARNEVDDRIPTDVAAAMIDIQCNAVLLRMTGGEDPQLLRAQAMLAFSVLTNHAGEAPRA